MDMDQAAVWLAGSILTVLGFIVIVIGVVIVNNILHKFWKPVRLFVFGNHMEPSRFMTDEEMKDYGRSEEKRNA